LFLFHTGLILFVHCSLQNNDLKSSRSESQINNTECWRSFFCWLGNQVRTFLNKVIDNTPSLVVMTTVKKSDLHLLQKLS
jgi:hypothetical protein